MNSLIKIIQLLPKKVLFIPVGIAGSGKTTFRKFLLEKYPQLKVVSPDEIRFRLLDFEHTGCSFKAEIEPQVWEEAYNELRVLLSNHKTVFFDATNLSTDRRKPLIVMEKEYKYVVHIHELFINPLLAYLRGVKRGREVPLDVIEKMWNNKDSIKSEEFDSYSSQYQMPTESELQELNKREWLWWQW